MSIPLPIAWVCLTIGLVLRFGYFWTAGILFALSVAVWLLDKYEDSQKRKRP